MFTVMCVTLTLAYSSSGANILVINPSVSFSHVVAFSDLWEKLSLRGHNITSFTMFPMNYPKLMNITEINVGHTDDIVTKYNMTQIVQADIWNSYKIIQSYAYGVSEALLLDSLMERFLRGKEKFDVVIVQFWFPVFLAFGEIFNCPTILISSYYVDDYLHHAMGNPIHPVSHPHLVLPFYQPLDFKERILSTLHTVYRWYVNTYEIFPRLQELIDKHFNISATMVDIIRDVDMMFVSTHPAVNEVRSLGPATITMGYHRQPTSFSLKKDLKDFMDNAKNGFVYFSLGTNVKSIYLNKNVIRTILEAMRAISCKFLYKYEGDDIENKPDNVMLIKWAPQHDILKHPNIKLFVMQGGFQSMEEAIYNAVPMVVIPFFVDQYRNAKQMERKGIAKVVTHKPFTKEDLVEAFTEVLRNPSFKEKVTSLRDLAQDVPMNGLDKAIWWIEYLIRHKGAKHLRNPAADLPFYQHLLLDVIGFIILVIVACAVLLYLLISKLVIKRIVKPVMMKYKKD